jgi:hypothetical protein
LTSVSPQWFGPWAGGIEVDKSQHPKIDGYTWVDASNVVVHAMADGEWGGTQFRVASAKKAVGSGNPQLTFSMGGFQQARGAMLGAGTGMKKQGNRFYMEGALEMVDAPGEWFFDARSRELYVFPPEGSVASSATAASMNLLLTQTDTIFAFEGSSSESRVQNIVLANLSIGHTSAQFFRPHEETSGGDYATHRSGAVKIENATGVKLLACSFMHIGGNAVFLSNSVRNSTVSRNLFQWLGTSGVAVQGKTGGAMMDGRDGEMLMAMHGPAADNGVRLPKHNLVENNVFADYGIWDKQSACYHKALAPGNMFKNNVCFNSSRHGVNFQDGFGGGGIAEGNVMFNLNRETSDTTAFNSWNRRNYITSPSSGDPAAGILLPEAPNEWRRNLVLGRDYYGIRDGNGNGLRNDDGASNYLHSNNVLYKTGVEFNGGTQIHTFGNLFIGSKPGSGGWRIGPTPDVASSFNDTFVDVPKSWQGSCQGFWNTTGKGPGKINQGQPKPGIYTGDYALGVTNSTGQGATADFSSYYCGYSLQQWQANTKGQDMHSAQSSNADGRHSSGTFLAKARAMMFNLKVLPYGMVTSAASPIKTTDETIIADPRRAESLFDAVDAARQVLRSSPGAQVTVALMPGRHLLTWPLRLGDSDRGLQFVGSSSPAAASISGGIAICDWRQSGPALPHLWQATVPAGTPNARQLWVAGQRYDEIQPSSIVWHY